MLRRSHQKSRNGCLECKRRHVKCDEGRPRCQLCIFSQRQCTFPSVHPPSQSPSASSDKASPCSSSDDQFGGPAAPLLATLAQRQRRQQAQQQPDFNRGWNGYSLSETPIDTSSGDHHLRAPLNYHDLELLLHLTTDRDMFLLSGVDDTYPKWVLLALNKGLEFPYLLPQLLAYSARRLAHLRPHSAAFYLREAVLLQNEAIALFTSSWVALDETNCVPALIFSSILGHHVFADTLAQPDRGGGLEFFMSQYAQCLRTHRGIYTIAMTGWDHLNESEMGTVLCWSRNFTSQEPLGTNCSVLNTLIDGMTDITPTCREMLYEAVRHLQVGFDAITSEIEEEGKKFQMIFLWTMLMPTEVANLLIALRPEALVIMSYYALLMHYGSRLWQIGNAGRSILTMISNYLPDEWFPWLEYPRSYVFPN